VKTKKHSVAPRKADETAKIKKVSAILRKIQTHGWPTDRHRLTIRNNVTDSVIKVQTYVWSLCKMRSRTYIIDFALAELMDDNLCAILRERHLQQLD
jgi:hypothetical protein